MIIARRSLATIFFCLCCLSMAAAQQENPSSAQSPAPIVTATASAGGVDYVSVGRVYQTRLQVFTAEGAQVFDSNFQLGNLVSWRLQDQQGSPLTDGTYLYLVTVKDFAERVTQKYGTAVLERERVYLEQPNRNELPQLQATALEANRVAETLSTVDRVGVAAMNRTTSPPSTDGTNTAGTEASSSNNSNPTTGEEKLTTGTGTQNYLARWIDNAGTLGDSAVFDDGGKVGIGTTTPNANTILHLHKSWNNGTAFLVSNDNPGNGALVTMRAGLNPNNYAVDYASLNVLSANWTPGSAGPFLKGKTVLIEGNGSNFGIGNINNTEPLIFYTTASRLERMRVAADGNVGIGTGTPAAKLHVAGIVNFTGFRTELTDTFLFAPNVIGGSASNSVTAGMGAATIGGGGYSGSPNRVTNYYGTVSGGVSNTAGEAATVGGGVGNSATGHSSTIAGGYTNTASDTQAAIGGGFGNNATGALSTIPGGYQNRAEGDYSFAAGYSANALQEGTFVWSDRSGGIFSSTSTNQFLIRAAGGVGINTNAPRGVLDIQGGADGNGAFDPRALAFSYRSGGYRHWVRTRHNSFTLSNNAIDFFVNSSSNAAGSSAPGTGSQHVMTIEGTNGGSVGIGTSTPNARLQVVGGDAAVTTSGTGLILRATDGANCFRVTVNNAGVLTTAPVGCP